MIPSVLVWRSWQATSPIVFSDLELICWVLLQIHFVVIIHLFLHLLSTYYFCFASYVSMLLLFFTFTFFSSNLLVFCLYLPSVTPPLFPVLLPHHPLCLVFFSHLPPAPIFSLSFLLLHHPWHSSSAHCTNLPWQWIVSKIIPIAQRLVLSYGSHI